jgi:oxalate decarboxylase/phosphoglucose isomerase-like protein (cupin superfamily)
MSMEVSSTSGFSGLPVTEPRFLKDGEGRFILEGQECTQIYFHTDKIVFSVSTLLPGQQACLDKGHPEAHEIVYLMQGTVMLYLTGISRCYRLCKGDALLIPPGEPHYTVNVGTEQSVAVWACAPHL